MTRALERASPRNNGDAERASPRRRSDTPSASARAGGLPSVTQQISWEEARAAAQHVQRRGRPAPWPLPAPWPIGVEDTTRAARAAPRPLGLGREGHGRRGGGGGEPSPLSSTHNHTGDCCHRTAHEAFAAAATATSCTRRASQLFRQRHLARGGLSGGLCGGRVVLLHAALLVLRLLLLLVHELDAVHDTLGTGPAPCRACSRPPGAAHSYLGGSTATPRPDLVGGNGFYAAGACHPTRRGHALMRGVGVCEAQGLEK